MLCVAYVVLVLRHGISPGVIAAQCDLYGRLPAYPLSRLKDQLIWLVSESEMLVITQVEVKEFERKKRDETPVVSSNSGSGEVSLCLMCA